jgi:hypothetical protein
MRIDVDKGKQEHGISSTFVEIDVVVEWDKLVESRETNNSNKISAHGQQENRDIECKD